MTLLIASPEAAKKYIDNLDAEVQGIRKNAITMAWNMRGGATYEDILNMSLQERQEIIKLIEEHMDITKKTELPYF